MFKVKYYTGELLSHLGNITIYILPIFVFYALKIDMFVYATYLMGAFFHYLFSLKGIHKRYKLLKRNENQQRNTRNTL